MSHYSGGCLCGAVRIEITAAPDRVGICHCLDCRKRQGAIFHTFVVFPIDAVTVTGETREFKTRSFCPTCGSPLFDRFGANVGADIPTATDYVGALRPLLNRFGNDPALSIIVFTLDESTYARELAPLAGHYPALKLGPSWWFHDSPEGMMRFREQTTETAGFYNTVGFNDDTRAFMSIPSRHDVARRVDCSFLARLVVEHRLPEDEAALLAPQLAYEFPKKAYKL